jgi:hypothetical protein
MVRYFKLKVRLQRNSSYEPLLGIWVPFVVPRADHARDRPGHKGIGSETQSESLVKSPDELEQDHVRNHTFKSRINL